MIKVKHTITPVEDLAMDEIAAFETESFYGFYCDTIDNFVLVAKDDSCFNINIMPKEVSCDDLGEINNWVSDEFCEEIIGVHRNSKYKIILE